MRNKLMYYHLKTRHHVHKLSHCKSTAHAIQCIDDATSKSCEQRVITKEHIQYQPEVTLHMCAPYTRVQLPQHACSNGEWHVACIAHACRQKHTRLVCLYSRVLLLYCAQY